MEAFKGALITILATGLFLLSAVQVIAGGQSLTTTIYITILERPEILTRNEDVSNCFNSQIKENPASAPKVNVEEIQERKTKITRYTICEEA